MGGSLTVVKCNPPVSERDQSLLFQPIIGQPPLDSLCTGAVPITLTGHAATDGQLDGYAELDQVADLRSGLAPLFPITHAYPSSNPVIQLHRKVVLVGNSIVVDPTAEILTELADLRLH